MSARQKMATQFVVLMCVLILSTAAWSQGGSSQQAKKGAEGTSDQPCQTCNVGIKRAENTSSKNQHALPNILQADLVADRVYLRTAPAGEGTEITTPTAGDTVYFYIDWRNQGSTATGTFRLELRLDGVVQCAGDFNVEGNTSWFAWCIDSWMATAGTHTIEGVLDANNSVAESNENNNNVSLTFTVAVGDQPDLVVAQVQSPSVAYSGQQTQVSWIVSNVGKKGTNVPRWSDRLSLSQNPMFGQGAQIFLGSFDNVSYLHQGESYSNTATLTLPKGIAGDYYVFVVTDAYNDLQEKSEANNHGRNLTAMQVNLSPFADLRVTSLIAPDNVFSGQPVNVSWTVKNLGAAPTEIGDWFDALYFSQDTLLNTTTDSYLGSFTHNGALAPDSSYSASAKVKIPQVIFDEYYVFVVSDRFNNVYEYVFDDNNARRSKTINVTLTPTPDFVVNNVIGPSAAESGRTIDVQWIVQNHGAGAPFENQWSERVYLYAGPELNPDSAMVLDTFARTGTLQPDSSYTVQRRVMIPNGISGSYYLFVKTDWDNKVFEYLADGNNIRRSENAIQINLSPWPDLQVTSLETTSNTAAGQSISISWTVTNAGTENASSWSEKLYVSSNPTWDTTAIFLKDISALTPLAPSAKYTQTTSATLPTTIAGTYYLYVVTDASNRVYEHTDEGNNVGRSDALAVQPYPPVDLTITSLSSPASGSSGQPINMGWTVQNIGGGRTLASNWFDAVYLSADTILDPKVDKLIATVSRSGFLDPNESYSRNLAVTLPNGTMGNYHLIVKTDTSRAVTDSNPDNNHKGTPISMTLTPSPDLQVTALSVPSLISAGQPITMQWTVQNAGVGATPGTTWYDAVYLSNDMVLDTYDTKLGTATRSGALAPNASYNASLQVDIPSFVSGDYYLMVLTDSKDEIYEHNTESNNIRSSMVKITVPPPADLVIASVGIPDSALPGEEVTVTWTIRNQGPNVASGWLHDGVYFSSDTSWTVNAPLLGIYDRYINLAAGATFTISAKVNLSQVMVADSIGNMTGSMPGLVPGNYFAIVRVDLRNSIREIDDNNNLRVSANTMTVTVPELPLGLPVTTILSQGRSRYYRVNVPNGVTLRLTLNSDLPSASNEQYVRYAEVPTLDNFDFAANVPFTPDQAVTVPSTSEGTYYILVFTRSSGSQSLILRADTLSFQLTRITPSRAGNAGQVTVKIEGAQFDFATEVALRPAGSGDVMNDIHSIWLKRSNSSVLYATFDLRGAAPGLYDVRAISSKELISADTTTFKWFSATSKKEAVLPSAFEVISGGGARLEARLHVPESVRQRNDFTFTLEAANTGNIDVPAPVLLIFSPNRTPLSAHLPVRDNDPFELQVVVLGPEGRRDVLAPGQIVFVPLYAKAVHLPSSKFLLQNLAGENIPLDWDAIESYYRDSSPDEQWRETWRAFKALVGSTWEEFHNALRQAIVERYPGPSVQAYPAHELLADLFAQARGPSQARPLQQAQKSAQALFANRTNAAYTFVQTSKDIHVPPTAANVSNVATACDTCALSPLEQSIVATEAQAGASLFWASPWPYAADALFHFVEGTGTPLAYAEGDKIVNHILSDPNFNAVMSGIAGQAKSLVSRNEIAQSLECETAISIDLNDLFASRPDALRPSFDFNASGGGLGLTLGAVPGNNVAPPRISGTVNLVRVCNDKCDKTDDEIQMALFLHVHMEDLFDFCPGSFGTRTNILTNEVIGRVQQLEACGWAKEFEISIDFDTYLFRTVTLEPKQPPVNECPADSCKEADHTPPDSPECKPKDYDTPTVVSKDPNDIIGPTGYGDPKWVAIDQTLPYTIRFENDPQFATAPAQAVTISQQLDTTLDARSFRLGGFGFGRFTFSPPENSSFYTQRLDVRDSLGVYVDINAGLDITSNKIFWIFNSVDPATGLAPANPLSGFLKVNDSLHRGEGFVSYTVRPKRTSRTREVVNAKARIVFDVNEPIDTPPIFNTIDAIPPVSRVRLLPPTISSASFVVSWSGRDDSTGSGIESYTIFVSRDNIPYEAWLTNVTDTSATYTGVVGSSYRFYSIARDHAGIVEPHKTAPDAVTVITSVRDLPIEIPKAFALYQNFPNPFNPSTTIRFDVPRPSLVTIKIYDILGREVKTLLDRRFEAGSHAAIWDGKNSRELPVASGVYFVRMHAGEFVRVRKLALVR